MKFDQQIFQKGIFVFSLALTALTGYTQEGQASSVFNLDGYGPISRSMGGTGAAYDIGTYGLMINPATLALIPSRGQVDLGLDVIIPYIKTKNLLTGQVAINRRHSFFKAAVYAPQLGIARHFKHNLTFGVGAFAQGGVGCNYGNRSFLSTALNGQPTLMEMSSKFMVLRFPVGVAYQPHPRLILGGSIDPMVQGVNLNDLLQGDQLGSFASTGRINGTLLPVIGGIPGVMGGHLAVGRGGLYFPSAWAGGISGKLGGIVNITKGTKFGGVFHFPSAMSDMKGPAVITAVSAIQGPVPLQGRIAFKNVRMPAQMIFGISQEYKRLLATAEFNTAFWQPVMKNFNATFTDGAGRVLNRSVPLNFRNSYVLGMGVQYKLNNKLSLRSGVSLGNNVVPPNTLLALIPAFPCRTYTCGATYAITERTFMQFAYTHTYMMNMQGNSLPNISMSAPLGIQHTQNNFQFNLARRF